MAQKDDRFLQTRRFKKNAAICESLHSFDRAHHPFLKRIICFSRYSYHYQQKALFFETPSWRQATTVLGKTGYNANYERGESNHTVRTSTFPFLLSSKSSLFPIKIRSIPSQMSSKSVAHFRTPTAHGSSRIYFFDCQSMIFVLIGKNIFNF